MALSIKEANEMLPDKVSKININPIRRVYLGIAPPKWGKTSWFCSIPNSVLLATEEGHGFQETHKIIIDSWDKHREDKGLAIDDDGIHHLSLIEAVDALCASDKFDFVIIDTADMAGKMCLDWHYKKYGVSHASDAGDYGKGWDLCLTQPFRQVLIKIMKSGRGVGFITHAKIKESKLGKGTTTKVETTLPSQVQHFLHTQADVILHGSFGRLRVGMHDRDRIISMDGSNEILAGSRIKGVDLPRKFIVDHDKQWEQWVSFFKDPKATAKANLDYEQKVLKSKGAVTEEQEPDPDEVKISESASELKSDGGATATVATTEKTKPRRRFGKNR